MTARIISFVIFLILFFNFPHIVLAKDWDLNMDLNAPDVNMPDYSKNECPVCDVGLTWFGNKGCCKTVLDDSSTSSVNFGFKCEQPNIVTCNKSFFCVSGKGCISGGQTASFKPSDYCNKLASGDNRDKCASCMSDGKHVWSGIGCLPSEFTELISSYIISLAVGLGGMLSFITFLYGSFLIMTSGGDAEQIILGKRRIFSALKGIMIIIFAVFILKMIGVNILGIPGFS